MNDEHLTNRLRRLGEEPVDPGLRAAHLTAMAAAAQGRRGTRFHRLKVGGAFAAGLLLGGTSLASAGALGTGAQDVVADTAAHVGVDLPGGKPRSTAGCDGKVYKNHGDFVSQGGDPHAECGKPVKADKGKDKDSKDAGAIDDPDAAEKPAGADSCKPPWAGKGNKDMKTPAADAEHAARCGAEDGTETEAPDVEDDQTEAKDEGAVTEETTTTVTEETTTTATSATTTTTSTTSS